MSLDQIIDNILKLEGGYVNNPNDHGGPTNFGVIQSEYSVFLGRSASIQDVKNMKISEAREIFKKKYYLAPKIDTIADGLQPVVTDACVLYGPKRAIIFLQEVLKDHGAEIDADGSIGDKTATLSKSISAILGSGILVNAYVNKRIEFCQRIVARNPSQSVFLKGWTNRSKSFLPKGK